MKRLNLKQYLSLLLALLLVFTLAACGNRENPPAVDATPDSTRSTGSTETAPLPEDGDTTESGDPSLDNKVESTEPNDRTTATTEDTSSSYHSTDTTYAPTTTKPTTGRGSASHTGATISGGTKPTTTRTTAKTTLKTTTTTQGKPTYTPATGTHTTTAPSADKVLVDQLFTLSVGASRDNVTLFGVVTDVREVSDTHGNATFTIRVQSTDGFREIYCYRVKPAADTALQVTVGDNLTLSGTVQNYKGTIEFYPAEFQNHSGGGVVTTTTTASTTRPADGSIDVNGVYTRKEDVALYLHVYGRLPQNFVTKAQYKSLGRPTDKCCGGDRFYNNEGLLPNKAGRLYYECDIDTLGKTSRGTKRIVFSNDGLIYYTADHYGSFTLLYGEP